MGKILITSDVHVHNYSHYNVKEVEPSFRMYQFIKLAHWINERVAEEDVEEIWICGDLFVVPNPNPVVINIAKRFFEIISAHVSKVRFISGNHDYSTKKNVTNKRDYNLMDLLSKSSHNIRYYDEEVVDIQGVSVHFHDWTPSGINNRECDILVAHDDVAGFSYTGGSCTHGIQTSTYNLCFVGHIHKHQTVKNAVSPGTPIQHNYGDHENTGVVIFDIDKYKELKEKVLTGEYSKDALHRSWKFIETGEQFLKFKTVDSQNALETLAQDTDIADIPVAIRIKPASLSSFEVKDIDQNMDLDPKSIAKHLIPDDFSQDIKDELNKIIDASYNIDYEVPDLNFKLKKATISGFLSITEETIDFTELGKLTTIMGENGHGKTTLFNFIEWMFYGVTAGRPVAGIISKKCDHAHGELELEYKGQNIVIVRDRGAKGTGLKFTVNGNDVQGNASKDIQAVLRDTLSFLEFWDIIYIKQESPGIFSSMNDSSRVSFLSKFIGLPIIMEWTKAVELLESSLSSKITEEDTNRSKNLGVQDHIERVLEDYKDIKKTEQSVIDLTTDHLNQNKKSIETDYPIWLQVQEKKKWLDKYKVELQTIIDDSAGNTEELAKLNNDLDACNVTINNNKEVIKTIEESLGSYKDSESQWSEYVTNFDKNTLTPEVNKLKLMKNQPKVCPTCSQDITTAPTTESITIQEELVTKLQNEYKGHYDSYQGVKLSLNTQMTNINEGNNVINNTTAMINNIVTKINVLNMTQSKIDDKRKAIEELSNEIASHGELGNVEQSTWDRIKREIEEDERSLTWYTINDEKYNSKLIRTQELETTKANIIVHNDNIESLQRVKALYSGFRSKILTDKGLLVANLLKIIANRLNTDSSLVVETTKTLGNGNIKPTLNIKLYVEEFNEYMDYSELSGGQRLMADIKFCKGLTGLIGGMGHIFLDEIMKFFSEENVIYAAEELKEMRVDSIMLILHGVELGIANTSFNVQLGAGGSKYSLRGVSQ